LNVVLCYCSSSLCHMHYGICILFNVCFIFYWLFLWISYNRCVLEVDYFPAQQYFELCITAVIVVVVDVLILYRHQNTTKYMCLGYCESEQYPSEHRWSSVHRFLSNTLAELLFKQGEPWIWIEQYVSELLLIAVFLDFYSGSAGSIGAQ